MLEIRIALTPQCLQLNYRLPCSSLKVNLLCISIIYGFLFSISITALSVVPQKVVIHCVNLVSSPDLLDLNY